MKFIQIILLVFIFMFTTTPMMSHAVTHDHHHQATFHQSQTVYYNVESRIFHNFNCQWAERCTVNCISISVGEAIRRGGRACKVCGG